MSLWGHVNDSAACLECFSRIRARRYDGGESLCISPDSSSLPECGLVLMNVTLSTALHDLKQCVVDTDAQTCSSLIDYSRR